ncbi:MAG: DUF202 domain-containing protein [Oligoflexia bacterium]|nr:DUF202 domain-containing protein [Oligoflexia bacterium]
MSVNSKKRPYSNFTRDQLILRDWLAIDRTILANKRTVLAYIRTAMAFFISGVTAIHFVESPWIKIFGGVLVIVSIIILIMGFYDFYKYQKDIEELLKDSNIKTETSPMPEPAQVKKE